MKLLAMLFLTVFGFFNLLLDPFIPDRPDSTDWFRDGVYQGFFYDRCESNPEERFMERLLELSKAGDSDSIYEAFSAEAKQLFSDELRENIPELMDFLGNTVTSWEFDEEYHDSGAPPYDRRMFFDLHTEEGDYRFLIRDYISKDTTAKSGFTSLAIFPEELHEEYIRFYRERPGAHIVYRAGGENNASAKGAELMGSLADLMQAGNADGLCELFSADAKETADNLSESARELENFFGNSVASWEPYSWTQYVENPNTVEETFFLLHTAAGDYRCDIRNVSDSKYNENIGLFSIAVFPALKDGENLYDNEWYSQVCNCGREEAGILIVLQRENPS